MKYKINKDPRGPLYITESEEMKLNYNCPADQKNGEGPGSCGGAAGGEKKKSSGSSKTSKGERFGGRHITEMEDDDLSLPELKEKLAALKEGHEDETARIVEKSIKSRESTKSTPGKSSPITKGHESLLIPSIKTTGKAGVDDYTPESAQKTIDIIDKSIGKLESELASNEKYLKENGADKRVKEKTDRLRKEVASLKAVNQKNKDMLASVKKSIGSNKMEQQFKKDATQITKMLSGSAKFDLTDEAIQDFADNMGEKPSDEDILSRGVDAAPKGSDSKKYAENYLKEYNKAWKVAEKDAKDNGWE